MVISYSKCEFGISNQHHHKYAADKARESFHKTIYLFAFRLYLLLELVAIREIIQNRKEATLCFKIFLELQQALIEDEAEMQKDK